MKGVLGLEAYDVPEVVEVNKRQQKTINIKAIAESVAGTTLNITLGVDPELVAAYNAANNTSYEMLPADAYGFVDAELMLPKFNTVSSLGQLNLIGRGCNEEQIYLLPVVLSKVEGSDNWTLAENKSVIYLLFKMLPALKGVGTVDDPYVIEELEDFITMNEKLLSGDKVYFKMLADIDMAGVEDFIPLNGSPYDCQVIFDGQGHKISNYSCPNGMFHVLNGSVENLIIENANVAGGANMGILAHYIGYTKGENVYTGKVKNIVFKDCSFSGANDSGMLSGYTFTSVVENVYMENCNIVLSGRRQGYLTGRIDGATDNTVIKNCYVKGGIASGGTQQVGGLIGQNNLSTATITNCGISATISGDRAMGAIMAYAKGPTGFTDIENCIVWSESIKCNPASGSVYSSGVVVGSSDQDNVTFKNCLYRSDIVFEERNAELGVLHNSVDIENAKLPTTTTADPSVYKNAFAWHGKAAAAGTTASQAAKSLGWPEDVWDLTGAEPRLKTIN